MSTLQEIWWKVYLICFGCRFVGYTTTGSGIMMDSGLQKRYSFDEWSRNELFKGCLFRNIYGQGIDLLPDHFWAFQALHLLTCNTNFDGFPSWTHFAVSPRHNRSRMVQLVVFVSIDTSKCAVRASFLMSAWFRTWRPSTACYKLFLRGGF